MGIHGLPECQLLLLNYRVQEARLPPPWAARRPRHQVGKGSVPGRWSGSAGQHMAFIFSNPLVRVLAQGTASFRIHPRGSSIQLTSQGGAKMGLSQLPGHAPSSGVTWMPASGRGRGGSEDGSGARWTAFPGQLETGLVLQTCFMKDSVSRLTFTVGLQTQRADSQSSELLSFLSAHPLLDKRLTQ